MENKKLFKELLYLGLGTAVITGNKIRDLLQKLVNNHKMTEEEGEKALNHIIAKSKEIRKDIDEFTMKFSERTKIAKKEVQDFVEEIMAKPKEVKDKIEILAKKASVNTNLKVEFVKEVLADFVDDITTAIHKARFKAEEWIEENKSRMDKTKLKGKELVEEIKVKSHHIADEFRPGLKVAMNNVLKRMNLVSEEEFAELEGRVHALEKKELVK